MGKTYKVFISSVQKEFENERIALQQYLQDDALLSGFFTSYLFEADAAVGAAPDAIYLDAVADSDIYIGLLGTEYGYEDADGVSPTEREFDLASTEGLNRWIYIKGDNKTKRHDKEKAFINKVRDLLSYKRFIDLDALKKEVYNSCIKFLKETGNISSQDFDNSLHEYAAIKDIDPDKVKDFVRVARAKRGFPLKETAKVEKVLEHLHMLRDGQLVNSSLLVFGDKPQAFFPTATVKCGHFHGTTITKPIPDLKEFGGTVFEMAVEAVDFVLSKISLSSGTRAKKNQVDTQYEIPREVIAEAIINAIAHRDYNSSSSIQVYVFADRVEIFNAGELTDELDIEKLKVAHSSYPSNPILAESMFLTGDIERFGTGMIDIFRLTAEAGLGIPDIDLSEGFKVILWRPSSDQIATGTGATDQVTVQVTVQVTDQVNELVKRLISITQGSHSTKELMATLQLKHRPSFKENYLDPAIANGYIEMTDPDSPRSPKQKYRLTQKGKALQKQLES